MNVLICNVPVRAETSTFPPIGCTSLLKVLLKAGYKATFLDLDAQRPAFDGLAKYFRENIYDVVGISAVVSTSYEYTKKLSEVIKQVSPTTKIILGGNLGAASDVILNKCPIDICVIGEGEKVLINLLQHFEQYHSFDPADPLLMKIKGVALLDSNRKYIFTGNESLIDRTEIEQPDYDLLKKHSKLDQYILDPMTREDFSIDPRSHETHRIGKKMATIITSKGCINSCSFCHRWIKKYRVIPLNKVINYIKYLIEYYNVGFFCIADECFGENQKWLDNFIELLRPLDILFQVGGARVSLVKKDPTVIQRLKEVGLTAIYFGTESGSDKILRIMDKNASTADNVVAARACNKARLYSTIQLVIGMPGENDATINETIDFLKEIISPHFLPIVTINYLQSLPGTPTYEFLRCHGFLGNNVDEEEQYLLKVSNKDASDFNQYINVSEEPLSKVYLWRQKIHLNVIAHWLKKHEWNHKAITELIDSPTIHSRIPLYLLRNIILYRVISIFPNTIYRISLMKNRYKKYGLLKTLVITLGLLNEEDRSAFKIDGKSLKMIIMDPSFKCNTEPIL